MEIVTIGANEAGQRLDRFLKKYLRAAPLSLVYRLVRKNVKVNGERKGIDYMVAEGDELALYIDGARLDELARRDPGAAGQSAPGGGFLRRPKVQFKVCYEDENILAVSKPYGLLTHGDGREKKDTLVNQVIGYLADRGEYDPAAERLFTPSPTGRLDRNTSGIVVFGKNAKAVRDFNRMVTAEDAVEKYYLTLALGAIEEELTLDGSIVKDEARNRVSVASSGGTREPSDGLVRSAATDSGGVVRAEGPSARDGGPAPVARPSVTVVRPLERYGDKGARYTLAEVWLVTGRPHQIRAHLAAAGHPVIGDPKYGDGAVNRHFAERYGLTAQFLHAHRLEIKEGCGSLEYLAGAVIESPLPRRLAVVAAAMKRHMC
jgi:23S rRNA pseudouridine955/2504/2580 synthase